MLTRSRRIGIVLILITGLIVVSGCLSDSQSALPQGKYGEDILPQDKYVAVEEQLKVTSNLISGKYPFPPHVTVPEVFNYDGSVNGSNWAEGSGWMNNHQFHYPGVNDSFKVLYGSSFVKDVTYWDTRTGLSIRGVYSFPYAGESGFTIQKVARNGTVYGSYNSSPIVLMPGEQWVSPVAGETRSDSGTDLSDKPYSYTATYNTTWTVSNLGIVDKANLTRHYGVITF
jgi:hypothetical protein